MEGSPLEFFVLCQGRRSQAGNAVAEAVLRLGEAGYLTLSHKKTEGIILSRTSLRASLRDADWKHSLLAALFSGEETVQLGGSKNATKPIASRLMRSAQKNVLQNGLMRRLRPRLVLIWARIFALMAWFAFLGVQVFQTDWAGLMGVGVLGVVVWIGVFLACLEPLCKRCPSLTDKGEATLAELRLQYADFRLESRPKWWHGLWSAAALDDTTTTMAKALSQRKWLRWLRALQVDEKTAIAEAS